MRSTTCDHGRSPFPSVETPYSRGNHGRLAVGPEVAARARFVMTPPVRRKGSGIVFSYKTTPDPPVEISLPHEPFRFELAGGMFRRLALGNREGRPGGSGEVPRQVDQLSDVVRRVSDRSVERFDNQEGFAADVERPCEIVRGRRGEA